MKTVIFTENEKIFTVPLLFEVMQRVGSRRLSVCSVVISKHYGKDTGISTFKKYYWLLGVKGTSWIIFNFLRFKLQELLNVNPKNNIDVLKKIYNFELLEIDDINQLKFEEYLIRLKPDLGISLSFGQIFSENIISKFKNGIINLHASLLPKYRGLMPNFWVLYFKEENTGVTVHKITSIIDGGEIISQIAFTIPKNITYVQLVRLSKSKGILALSWALDSIKNSNSQKKVQNGGEYFGFPKKEDFLKYHKDGGKFI